VTQHMNIGILVVTCLKVTTDNTLEFGDRFYNSVTWEFWMLALPLVNSKM